MALKPWDGLNPDGVPESPNFVTGRMKLETGVKLRMTERRL